MMTREEELKKDSSFLPLLAMGEVWGEGK